MAAVAIGTTLPPGPERRRALDEVAETYDRYRPGYPADLAGDVALAAGLGPGARILEIGCGTGQLTRSFAGRGYSIVALEPGPRLAERTRQNFADSGDVQVVVTTLEDWDPAGERFALVMAGQSFHFLEPSARFRRVADLLHDSGALAVTWNYRWPGDSTAHRAVRQALQRHAPGFREDQQHLDTPFEDAVDASGLFGRVFMRRYQSHRTYSTDEYLGLLASHSTLHVLPDTVRSELFRAVGAGLDAAGGQITVEYLTRLYVARKLPATAA